MWALVGLCSARFGAISANSWLALSVRMISGARAGLLLLEGEDGRFATAAVWPDPSRDVTYLGPAAEAGFEATSRHIERTTRRNAPRCLSIEVAGRPYGVVVVRHCRCSCRRFAIRSPPIANGRGWLETMFRRASGRKGRGATGTPPLRWTCWPAQAKQRAFRDLRPKSPMNWRAA